MTSAPRPVEPDEVVDLVDDLDRVVGTKARAELVDGVDRWRIVSLLVRSTSGTHVLLGRRTAHKRHDAGRWSPCVAGTVTSGDSYLDTVVRETFEEISVRVDPAELVEVYRGLWDSPGNLRHMALFMVHRDLDVAELCWDRSEADAMRWWHVDDLATAVARDPSVFSAGVPRMAALLTGTPAPR